MNVDWKDLSPEAAIKVVGAIIETRLGMGGDFAIEGKEHRKLLLKIALEVELCRAASARIEESLKAIRERQDILGRFNPEYRAFVGREEEKAMAELEAAK